MLTQNTYLLLYLTHGKLLTFPLKKVKISNFNEINELNFLNCLLLIPSI